MLSGATGSFLSIPLTIRLFGPPRVLVNGKPLTRVHGRSKDWLLALLVLRHPSAVDRNWLAGTLWLDSEPDQARKNLRNNLANLRAALGPEGARISSPTRDSLTLDLEGADVDVLRFDRGIRAGDEASLKAAVDCCAGPLLEGCYEEWAHPEREMREAQLVAALEWLADAVQGRGDHA